MVMLTRERIEEVLGEAVERGRVTTDDAQDLASGLLERGRKQTNDVLKDLEQLLGRSRGGIEGRASGARKAGTDAARRAGHRSVIYTSDKKRVIACLEETLRPGDLLLTLGAGDVVKFGEEYLQRGHR